MKSIEIAARVYLQVSRNQNKEIDLGVLLLTSSKLLQNSNIEEVLRFYKELQNRELDVVEIISAKKLEDSSLKDLEQKLITLFGEKIVMVYEIDTSLLGGMIIRKGDSLIDESVKSKISNVQLK
jgi:F-type H+-transporting ATPase subunit delta